MNNSIPVEKYQLPCLLYDDKCVLCVRFKDALLRIPGTNSILMIPLSNDEIYQVFPILNKKECGDALHIIDIDRNIYRGPEALTYLVNKFPGVSKFTWLIESNMGKKALSFFYETANKARDTLKKRCHTCK